MDLIFNMDLYVKKRAPMVDGDVHKWSVLDRVQVIVENPVGFEQWVSGFSTTKKGCGSPHPLNRSW